MKPGNSHDTEKCRAVADILSRIGDKWSVNVVRFLARGPMRFNEMRREISAISQRMLSLTLRGLERDGLVTRTVTPTIPPRVDYALTPLGKTLIGPICALSDWAIANQDAVDEARARFDLENAGSRTVAELQRKTSATHGVVATAAASPR